MMNKSGNPNPLMLIWYDDHESTSTPPTHSSSNSSVPEPDRVLQTPSSSSSTNYKFKTNLGRSSTFAYRIRDHVRLGRTLSETVRSKVRLGAKILKKGGREKIFKDTFEVNSKEGEELLKASQCYLSTTGGPIAGLLFISTIKVAFSAHSSITFCSPLGQPLTTPFKVVIPLNKIKKANQSENVENPAQKYIEIQTEDGYDFWFMGFLRYEKAFKNLQKAISLAN